MASKFTYIPLVFSFLCITLYIYTLGSDSIKVRGIGSSSAIDVIFITSVLSTLACSFLTRLNVKFLAPTTLFGVLAVVTGIWSIFSVEDIQDDGSDDIVMASHSETKSQIVEILVAATGLITAISGLVQGINSVLQKFK